MTASPTPEFYCAGDRSLLELPCVAIVGSRKASELGIRRARRLARELVEAGVVVMSGLARGVDVAAHQEAMARGGRTIAVVGTPLYRAYPPEHASLQDEIAARHLVVSPFGTCKPWIRGCFPIRNRLMAKLSQATVIVEATDRSGTLHQAEACARLGRSLFLCASLVANPHVRWPQRFAGSRTHVLTSTEQVLEVLRRPTA
jgi:DNA processing protein